MTADTHERSPWRSRRASPQSRSSSPPRRTLVLASLVLLACGGADGALGPEVRDDPPAIERYVDYPSEGQTASRVCGWVTIPSGQSAYYPCAAPSPESPVSDPPLDGHDVVELPDIGPRPPGDPTPL